MLMMAADGEPTFVLEKTLPIHSPTRPPYLIFRALELPLPPPHPRSAHNSKTHSHVSTSFLTTSYNSAQRLLHRKHYCHSGAIKEVWVIKKTKKNKTNTHNTAGLSSNVKGWAPRIQGASLMHLSWFSHQLTLLFTLRRWKTNTHK